MVNINKVFKPLARDIDSLTRTGKDGVQAWKVCLFEPNITLEVPDGDVGKLSPKDLLVTLL